MITSWLADTVTTNPARMVEQALLWGLDGLELRTVGGPSDRVPHINEAPLRNRLDAAEMAVTAIVPGLFEGDATNLASRLNDLSLLTESIAFGHRFRCRTVVVSSFRRAGNFQAAVDGLRAAGDRALTRDAVLAVANENGMTAGSPRELVNLVEAVGHPAVRAAWDPSVADTGTTEEDERRLAALAAVVRRVVGRVDVASDAWPRRLGLLAGAGYSGPVTLVLPEPGARSTGLSAATAMIHQVRAATGGKDQSTMPA